jgi:hypothetical protein
MGQNKEIQLTPDNVPDVIVTNPMTAKCLFKKGMEYERNHSYQIHMQHLTLEPVNEYGDTIGSWGYRYTNNPYTNYEQNRTNLQR